MEKDKKIKSSVWSRAEALKINSDDPTTTQPCVPLNFIRLNDDFVFWDTWALRDLEGKTVSFNGWHVIFQLTAPLRFSKVAEPIEYWNTRHNEARISFSYSRDGISWKYGGYLFSKSLTTLEWAGCCLLTSKNNIEVYYTAVGDNSQIVKTRGKIYCDENQVWFEGFNKFTVLLEADGIIYQNKSQNIYWAFRDPWVFRDPKNGKKYMLFEGNVPGKRGEHKIEEEEEGYLPPGCGVPGGAKFQTGCVGIAECVNEYTDEWILLTPLLTAVGVNDQTERPHFVFKNNLYYLFTISHTYTFSEGLLGPDGLYGFVSPTLTGQYVPLNASGLVLGNPSSQPFQTYSHYVSPDGLVQSFIDSIAVPKSNNFRIGGTLAPTVRIELSGTNTYLVDILDFGYIPAMKNQKYHLNDLN